MGHATCDLRACTPGNAPTILSAVATADFRIRDVKLGLENGRVYEIAIFAANRHPSGSQLQITLQGLTTKRSVCSAH